MRAPFGLRMVEPQHASEHEHPAREHRPDNLNLKLGVEVEGFRLPLPHAGKRRNCISTSTPNFNFKLSEWLKAQAWR
jgi:hypothetical protein